MSASSGFSRKARTRAVMAEFLKIVQEVFLHAILVSRRGRAPGGKMPPNTAGKMPAATRAAVAAGFPACRIARAPACRQAGPAGCLCKRYSFM